MIGRRQLPVASPISVSALLGAFADSLSAGAAAGDAEALVSREFGSDGVILTDSGTSALVLAFRQAAPRGGVVALPAYACVDLVAAARAAAVRVRLYDVDPKTLSPDIDSVRAVIERGVNAVVVSHLFGYPADVPAIRELAAASGVVVIEDAAQGAGGALHGRRLGRFGDVSILSFGRGKGLCAGGGGALIVHDADKEPPVEMLPSAHGWGGLVATAVQWVLGRPSLYALPAMLPWLHLGEMVYHDADEPRRMSAASRSLVESAFALEREDLVTRRANAAALERAASVVGVGRIRPIGGAEPGYLRYPIRQTSGRGVDPKLGIVRPYPRTLAEEPQLKPVLEAGEPPTPGARELARSLFALPTHRFVAASDLALLSNWISASRD